MGSIQTLLLLTTVTCAKLNFYMKIKIVTLRLCFICRLLFLICNRNGSVNELGNAVVAPVWQLTKISRNEHKKGLKPPQSGVQWIKASIRASDHRPQTHDPSAAPCSLTSIMSKVSQKSLQGLGCPLSIWWMRRGLTSISPPPDGSASINFIKL